MSTQNLKFIHLSTGSASAHKADTGAIIFEKATGRIAVATGANTDVEYYGGGRVSDATFDTVGKVLTLSFNDGSDAIKLDFSDTASATGVNAIMKAHADRISALETTVGKAAADGKPATGLIKAVADNKTAIDAINNSSTGILAEAKKYTDDKVGDIDGTVKDYVDTAKGAAIKDAKDYADGLADNYDAAGAAAQALADAKKYTDGKVSEINTTTDGLRSDLGTRGDGKGTAFARIEALEGTVGNASSGLVKNVADLSKLHADKSDKTGKLTVAEEVTAGVNAKVGAIDGTVKDYVDGKDTAVRGYIDSKVTTINGTTGKLRADVDTLKTTVGDDESGLVKKVNTLVGTDANKSVRTISAEEVAKVVAGADASYDTLKEIADWILNDTTGAASMANDISNLKTTVGAPAAAEGDKPATGLYKAIADETVRATGVEGELRTNITALQALHDGSKKVAQEVAEGIAGITEASKSAGTDVIVTVTTKAGSVSGVAVNASGLRNDLGQTTDASTVTTTAFGRIKALETTVGDKDSGLVKGVADNASAIKALQDAQASGSLMWSVWE